MLVQQLGLVLFRVPLLLASEPRHICPLLGFMDVEDTDLTESLPEAWSKGSSTSFIYLHL